MVTILVNSKKIDLIYDKADTVFKLLFLTISLFSYNSFITGNSIVSVIIAITTVLAGLLFIYKLFNWRSFIGNRFLWLIIAFMVSYGISAVVNIKYGIWDSIKTAVWMGMQYFLLFTVDTRKSIEDYKKQLRLISGFYWVYIFLANIVSLWLLIIRYSSRTSSFKPNASLAGFVWGRLWGVYTDPNVGAVMSIIAVIISLYFLFTVKKKWQKILLICGMVIDFFYITFSDSRTGIVAIVVAFGTVSYLLISLKKLSLKSVSNQVISISLALLIVGGCIVSTKLINVGYKEALNIALKYSSSVSEEEKDEIETQFDSRENDIKSDISNNRFGLWGTAIKTFLHSPIVGISFENAPIYTEKNLPDVELIGTKAFDRYHNMFFDVLVGQGIIGILIFLALSVLAGITAIKNLKENLDKKNKALYICLFGMLLAAICAAMFASDLVYVNTPIAAIFWYILGLILIKPAKEEN